MNQDVTPHPENNRKLYLMLGAALVVARIIGGFVLPVYDDAFITMRYARNLAHGAGFVFNPGEHVLGTTAPAFGIVLSLLQFLPMNASLSVRILNVICDVMTLFLTFRLFERSGMRSAGLLAALFFGLSPIMTRICDGGMEMNLFLLLSVSAILLYHDGRKTLSIVVSSMSYWLRPEAIVLVGVLLYVEWRQTGRSGSLRLAAVAAGCFLLPALVVYSYYGTVVSQSVIAKARNINQSIASNFRILLLPDVLSYLVVPFAIFGFVAALRGGGILRTVALWTTLYTLAFVIVRPHVWSWYTAPIQYGLYAMGAVGATTLIAPRLRPSWLRPAFFSPAASVLILVFWLAILYFRGPSKVTENVYAPLEKWCAAHLQQKSSALASDIGAIGFFSDAKIYDAAGLVWPQAQEFSNMKEILLSLQPDYVLLNATRENVSTFLAQDIATRYVPVDRFNEAGLKEIPVNADAYASDWSQDYIILKRRTAATPSPEENAPK